MRKYGQPLRARAGLRETQSAGLKFWKANQSFARELVVIHLQQVLCENFTNYAFFDFF
jgi:hypothetical protein